MMNQNSSKKLVALYDDCREGYVCCQDPNVASAKMRAMQESPGENQISYVNIFLTGAIKTHGTLVCNSDELFKALEEIAHE